jgi:hypothetical protein
VSISLYTLVQRLQVQAAARDNVPTQRQYEQSVRDAVVDFNNRASRLKACSFTITAGTAEYDLPADFWKFSGLSEVYAIEGVIVTDRIIPLPEGLPDEEYTVEGAHLTIYPTPTYTLTRRLTYGAGMVESGTPPTYASMNEREAVIVLKLARCFVLRTQEIAESAGVTNFKQGDVQIAMVSSGASLTAASERLLAEYEADVKAYVGSVLMM